jgi:general secretion pathway protein L
MAVRAKMPTSPTDRAVASTRLVFVDGGAAPGPWLLLEGDRVVDRGDAASALPAAAATVLVVPGEEVVVRWLDLAQGLAPAQAAAAARLMLADASAEPLASLHVAVGRAESGLTPAALVPAARMAHWLAAAAEAGLDPELVVPAPFLLQPPDSGFVRRDLGDVSDYRGPAAAFTLEPELANTVTGGAPVELIEAAAFESGLGPLVADPVVSLRQGPFARRRQWRVERGRVRRIAVFAIALALLSLAVQVVTILGYTFAADRAQAEADALAVSGSAGGPDSAPGFGASASLLFEAVRATPNAELARLEYRADGTLVATVTTDSPATLAALQARLETSGLAVTPGRRGNAGGRAATELTVRAG